MIFYLMLTILKHFTHNIHTHKHVMTSFNIDIQWKRDEKTDDDDDDDDIQSEI